MADDDEKNGKAGTRVFKKTSPNGKITTYLGKRDFLDHGEFVDIIDGMVLVDPEYCVDNKKVYATLLAAFRYGREDLDVLGLTFQKELIQQEFQVYPPVADKQRPLTRLQERLKKKLGADAYPFWFDIPTKAASSVTLQPAPSDTGKPCGVDYELKTYILVDADTPEERKPKKHSFVRLAIRKLTYAPEIRRAQPSTEVSKEFMMSTGLLHMEVSLDKEMYYHGESLAVNVHIQNNSNKSVKRIKASVTQVADICLFTTASYSCEVAKLESSEGFPVRPGGTLSKVYCLCPLLSNNKDKRGLALDGQLKHEDTNLASSTIVHDETTKENLGIIVQYKVKVRLSVAGALGGELAAELPFTLTHAKPAPSPRHHHHSENRAQNSSSIDASALDMDLIQLDTSCEDPVDNDDIVFEDFARLRLRGGTVEETLAAAAAANNNVVGNSTPPPAVKS